MVGKKHSSGYRVGLLLEVLGIDKDSYLDFVGWALEQQLIEGLANLQAIQEGTAFFSRPDALKQFRDLLVLKTNRQWSDHDLDFLFYAVKNRLERHFREPLDYGEYLKLLWTVPLVCARCDKEPPEVKLHVDHKFPSSKGGHTKRSNLQFLCAKCNLRKSDKLEGGQSCLDLK
ncbi:MAG TPA: HNH endonuclease [Chloroflexia bacterium]|nr:HNH endonuclease [Chloroflexia bacterium]